MLPGSPAAVCRSGQCSRGHGGLGRVVGFLFVSFMPVMLIQWEAGLDLIQFRNVFVLGSGKWGVPYNR